MTPCLYSLVCHVIVATGLLLGPRGSTLKRMEDETNCRILLRGRGASREGDADEFEPMHVVIEAGSDDALEEGKARINQILFDPAAAQRLKDEQRKRVRWSCVFPSAGSGVAWWWLLAPCVVFLQYSNGPWFVACLSCGWVVQMDEQAGVNGAATGGPTSGIPYVPLPVTVQCSAVAAGSSFSSSVTHVSG